MLTKCVCTFFSKIENNFLCIDCKIQHITALGTVAPVPRNQAKLNCDLNTF